MPIRLLHDTVIGQIAAGEVVERPASVVKELVENALDAGASTIAVDVDGGGRRCIRVSDDGVGIPEDQVGLAVARYATSKLVTADDLNTVQTLGFRGEALASIAAVAHLTLLTRTAQADAATQLRVEGGVVGALRAVGAPVGTIVTVENLFYNVPARLKFLKADGTEKRHVAAVVSNYALAYPEVRFVLTLDGREVVRTHGTGRLADALVATLGVDEFRQLVEVSEGNADSDVRVMGYTSVPSTHRSDRSRILLFVNGRWVSDARLGFAVVQAYHTFMMVGRYPVAALMIRVPPEVVDVNVHPAKAEVRFADANTVFSVVQRAVRRAVMNVAPAPSVRRSAEATHAPSETNLGHLANTPRQPMLAVPQGAEGGHGVGLGYDADDPAYSIPAGAGTPARPRTLPPMRVVGQVAAAYIVAEGPAGMYMIDQHAAHERVLYEQLMALYSGQQPVAQHTLDGLVLALPAPDAALVEAHSALLHAMGFLLEPFGPNTFRLCGVPALLADRDPRALIAGMIDDLAANQRPGERRLEEKLVLRICRQLAVKAGQVLSDEEMQGLLHQLERAEAPHTCPHGRPTMLHMSRDHIDREFGRSG